MDKGLERNTQGFNSDSGFNFPFIYFLGYEFSIMYTYLIFKIEKKKFKMTEMVFWCEYSGLSQDSPPPACGNNPKMRTKGRNSLFFMPGKTKKDTSTF